MANSVTARFNDDCKVFVSMSDDTTVEKAVIIDAEGNETDIGGGGGKSDFTKVKVTITLSGAKDLLYIPYAHDEEDDLAESDALINTDGEYDIILYKGTAFGYAPDIQQSRITVSGDILSQDSVFSITGAGAITISSID